LLYSRAWSRRSGGQLERSFSKLISGEKWRYDFWCLRILRWLHKSKPQC
jgi:hypothetical protein